LTGNRERGREVNGPDRENANQVALRKHLTIMVQNLERRFDDKVDSQDKRFEDKFASQDKALSLASKITDSRFESHNEFRDQINLERRTYVTHEKLELELRNIRNELRTY
jgi:hypothetical protein